MTDVRQMLDADVLTLGMAADEARRAMTGTNVVTYLVAALLKLPQLNGLPERQKKYERIKVGPWVASARNASQNRQKWRSADCSRPQAGHVIVSVLTYRRTSTARCL